MIGDWAGAAWDVMWDVLGWAEMDRNQRSPLQTIQTEEHPRHLDTLLALSGVVFLALSVFSPGLLGLHAGNTA